MKSTAHVAVLTVVISLLVSLAAQGQVPPDTAAAAPKAEQPGAPAKVADSDLLALVPAEAVFFLEHHGYDAIREAFEASNLGEIIKDEVLLQFVEDTRVQVGKMFLKDLYELQGAGDLDRAHASVHKLLKPFWYGHAVVFVTVPAEAMDSQAGIYCRVGNLKQECQEGLDAILKLEVAVEGAEGKRHAFTYKTGGLTFAGLASSGVPFNLSAQPTADELAGHTLLMFAWQDDMLCVATSVNVAETIAKMVSKEAPKSILSSESFAAVAGKTALKDWAFRWFANAEQMLKLANVEEKNPVAALLDVHHIRGVGGTGGYGDKVYTRMTYFDSPKAQRGLVRMFASGGSYAKALAMTPQESTIVLAGQLDASGVAAMIKSAVELAGKPEPGQGPAPGEGDAAQGGGTIAVMQKVNALIEASSGNAAFFMTDLQGLAGAVVIELKDADKGKAALDSLVALLAPVRPPDEQSRAPKPQDYRKIQLRPLGDELLEAAVVGNIVVMGTEGGVKSAIDAIIDKSGGFEPDSKADKYAKLAGEGAAVAKVDLAAVTKLLWPMLLTFSKQMGEFPLASLPSTEKLVKFLGPEIAVLQPDAGGLLCKSRGKVPFATKVPPFLVLMIFGSGL